MNARLQVALIAGIVVFSFFIFRLLLKKKLNLKYTLLWLAMIITLLATVLMPTQIGEIADFLGFLTPVNFIFVLTGMFTLLILVSLTAIISHMNKRIFKLVQQQALLEKRIRDLEEMLNNSRSDSNGNSV